MSHKTTAALLALLLGVCLAACSDDTDKSGVTPTPDADTGSGTDAGDTGDTTNNGNDATDTGPEDLGSEPDPDLPDDPDAADAADAADAPEDIEGDSPLDVPEDTADADTEPEGVMQECDDQTPCPDGYECVAGVCTLVPSGNVYIEDNYQLLRPTALTNVLSFFKGIFTDLGFFMTAMGPVDGDTIEEAVNRGYGRVDINLAAPSSKWQV